MSEIRIADLFAGIGGIRMGMVQALGDAAHVVYSSEWNKYSVQTYEANWHDENPVAGDITKVDEHDVPDIDLLLAGFPVICLHLQCSIRLRCTSLRYW